jgi:hypothetical protein
MLIEFADIWMIRKMLLNLRERAEALALVEGTGRLPQPIPAEQRIAMNESGTQGRLGG